MAHRRLRSWPVAALVMIAACSSDRASVAPGPVNPSSAGVPAGPALRILMLTATAGFRHDSIGAAREVMAALAASSRAFTVTATEDLSTISATTLTEFDVLFFAL